MPSTRSQLFLVAGLILLARAATAEPVVAPSEPLSPADEQRQFVLPPGFVIELVAAEPEIQKPMNLKFDARGRLWVTHTIEYPFPAADPAQARDAISVLSDFGADGRARKIERFADRLNIPIGVLPLDEGEQRPGAERGKSAEALCWSIPNIIRLADRDGDGLAEERSIAFGPFGVTDTHGNQNAFTHWVDGWVYANHGFSNRSQVKIGGEGPTAIEMQSGNTYRFRPDGSAIEQYSWGQVNPFGLAFDPLGNLFSADCHSRAISMLLREGYYQSFGKPHDGLGFAPDTTTINHGGTGIAAVAYYAAEHFPADYRDVAFIGNVITNRVHCDRLAWTGSSPQTVKVEDFVRASDPWFRPVDLQLGPDGALYIADFYNRIIGHYEVPLTHPGRDRERGRIWRVVYRPTDSASTPEMPDLAGEPETQRIARLGDANLAVRTMATHLVVSRCAHQQPDDVRKLLTSPPAAAANPAAWQAHALWALARLRLLDAPLARRLSEHPAALVRTHLAQALPARGAGESWPRALALERLSDSDPFVRRAAAGALAQMPSAENVRPILQALLAASADDPQLVHALRIALRDQLRSLSTDEPLVKLDLRSDERQALFAVAAVCPGPAGAAHVFRAARDDSAIAPQLLLLAAPIAAKSLSPDEIDPIVDALLQRHLADESFVRALLKGLGEGLAAGGAQPTLRMREALAAQLLLDITRPRDAEDWTNVPAPDAAPSASPWVVEGRRSRDGGGPERFVSSLREHNSKGERLTGVLRSRDFPLPERLAFWLCGHDGARGEPRARRVYVRLALANGEEVARRAPPDNDVAVRVEWNLSQHAGKQGHIEIVDGLASNAYAWLAVAGFEPGVVPAVAAPAQDVASEIIEACNLAAQWRLESLSNAITRQTSAPQEMTIRLAAAEALLTLEPDRGVSALEAIMIDSTAPIAARQRAVELLGRSLRDASRAALLAQLPSAPRTLATSIAAAIAGDRPSAAALLDTVRAGRASAALLREPTVVARLRSSGLPDLDATLAALTARLSPDDDRIAALIRQRRERLLAERFDPSAGQAMFARSVCKNCHKIGEVGANIAPALDGIGARGVDRLLEDVLDPNRNVDQAFRVTTIETDGGLALAGFGLREEGQSLLMYDATGQLQRVPLREVTERHPSTLSPMPANIAETMNEDDFCQLLAYLLSLKTK